MINIIKKEIDVEKSLRKRLEIICDFCNTTPTIINGSIRKIDKTNLSYIEPNKIIIKNPRKVTDEMAMEFYKKSNIPEKSYYKALGAVALMNYKNTALAILRDKVNKNNIDIVLEEWNDFIKNGGDGNRLNTNETIRLIDESLNDIKSCK